MTTAVNTDDAAILGDAVAPANDAPSANDAAGCSLPHPLWVNISPILESVAGRLSEAELDQWLADLHQANEGRGFNLELTDQGDLVISPTVNREGSRAEGELFARLFIWNETTDAGGEVHGANANLRLPDGARIRPDALWLAPEQVAALPPVSAGGAITVCPAFVAEIVSGTDTLPPLQRKMAQYIANGARLGWLIDPYRRRVYIYRPGVPAAILDDPETISGNPTLPGFVFAVRQRIFDLRQSA